MGMKFIPDNTHIPFTKYRLPAIIFSALMMLLSIELYMTKGLNFGIDFRGGVTVEIGPKSDAPEDQFTTDNLSTIREAVSALNLGEVKATMIGGVAGETKGIVVFVEEQPIEPAPGQTEAEAVVAAEQAQQQIGVQVRETINQALGYEVTPRRIDIVGPTVSGELVTSGITAVLAAVAMMLLYIWVRFEWQFSLGAVLALIHDVTLTIGLFSMLQLDFTLAIIAALLTIIGYSMNDTVIVFDRVRENLRKFKKMPLAELIDKSINDTLSRTLMTSGTTLLALFALFMLGGPALRGFTAAMIWGIFVGTYSSIFVASPLLLFTGVKRDWSTEVAKT